MVALVVGGITADGLVVLREKALVGVVSFAAEIGWPGPSGVAACLVAGIVGDLATLAVGGLLAWMSFRFALGTPSEIVLTEDGGIQLRSWLSTITLKASDVSAITTRGWFDPWGLRAVIRHKGGRVALVPLFPDFRELLERIRSRNPAVEINGF